MHDNARAMSFKNAIDTGIQTSTHSIFSKIFTGFQLLPEKHPAQALLIARYHEKSLRNHRYSMEKKMMTEKHKLMRTAHEDSLWKAFAMQAK